MKIYQVRATQNDALDDMSAWTETISLHASRQGAQELVDQIGKVVAEAVDRCGPLAFDTAGVREMVNRRKDVGDLEQRLRAFDVEPFGAPIWSWALTIDEFDLRD